MNKSKQKILKKKKRRISIRKKVFGTKERPRLCVYRSLKYLYCQIIDDTEGKTLVSATSFTKELKEKFKNCRNIETAKYIGQIIAQNAVSKGISDVVFDRSGFKYHGRIKALADEARKNGLNF